jgi:hypothetical protein
MTHSNHDDHPFAAQLAEGQKRGFVLCVACRKLGNCRLGIVGGERVPDETVAFKTRTRVKCPRDYEGGPGVAHGGWTASVLDEMFGHLALMQGLFTVTRSLTIERDLEGVVWIEDVTDGKWKVRGELLLVGPGTVLSRAHGLFIQRDVSHFKRHQEWLAQQDKA